jgi:hypothetical protein
MIHRKPNTSETSPRRSRLPLHPVRLDIWQAACELIAAGETRELSRVLASRFSTSERIIDMVLVIEGMRHERTSAALRTGIIGALEAAKDASAAIDLDLSDVA